MAKILGLDLGTNSIGWAVIQRNGDNFQFLELDNKPTKGVMVFPEGVKIEKGNEKSRAAERTTFRSARKLKFRRKLRKYRTLKALTEAKPLQMCPLELSELDLWRHSINPETGKKASFRQYPKSVTFLNWLKTDEQERINPYYFRDKFSRKKYDWESDQNLAYELGRAFYHLAQRRGFKSNRLEQSDETIISDKKDQIQEALSQSQNSVEFLEMLKEIFPEFYNEEKKSEELDATDKKLRSIWNYITRVLSNKVKGKDYSSYSNVKQEVDRYINRPENLGAVKGGIKELSMQIDEAGCETLGQYFWILYQHERSDAKNKIRTKYTAREEHYEKEFNLICERQELPDDLRTGLYKAIFYQRPLRSQKGLVGKCTFEKDKPRCPISRPEFEEFRMWSFINGIKIKNPDDEQLRFLNDAEKKLLVPKFYRQKATFKFGELAKALNPDIEYTYHKAQEAKSAPYLINFKLNTTVTGCPVSAFFKSIMGEDWENVKYTYQSQNNKKEWVARSVDYQDIWHVLFTYESNDKIRKFATDKLQLSEDKVRKFLRMNLQQGYGNLSLKAINKILPWLRKGLKYSHAVFMANIGKVVKPQIWKDEENRMIIEKTIGDIIDNHTNETRKINAVNSLIKEYHEEEHKVSYSVQAEPSFKNDIEKKLKAIYGKSTWEDLNGREKLLQEAFELLLSQMKKKGGSGEFAKSQRIDELIEEFLLDHDFVDTTKLLENGQPVALNRLFHPSDLEDFKPEVARDKEGNPIMLNNKELMVLPSPKTDAIKNPVLMRSMHQLRKLINELLKEGVIDTNTKIHLELAREVNDANKRAAWKEWQDSLRDDRENAIDEIKKMYKAECGKDIEPREDDILRFLLWEEQGRREIYEPVCKSISICDIIGADPKYDIEHTIPRSISWDNSMMNKTLCSKKFNRDVKRNRIPYELDNHQDILQRIEHWEKEFTQLSHDINNINASQVTDKEAKDRLIRKRHLLKFKHDYLKGKHDRFTMKEVPTGFKNSQLTDTGLITRYAKNYLGSLFRTKNDTRNVFVVNGAMVAEFREVWGLDSKSRGNHIHHCIDAIVIACMTKDKYDSFVAEWRKAEEAQIKGTHHKLKPAKPWDTFSEDIKTLQNEIVVVHDYRNNIPTQRKEKERKRGSIVYTISKQLPENLKDKKEGIDYLVKETNGQIEYKIPRYKQGDTARGSLHKDTFYGKIQRGEKGEFQYVVRKKLSSLKDSELGNIIDDKIREIVTNGRKQEREINKEIDKLAKQLKNAEAADEASLTAQIESLKNKIENEIYAIPPKAGKTKWMPIRKVRIKAHLAEPLPDFKEFRDKRKNSDGSEKHPYKKWVYVQNDENYGLVIYESEDMKKRAAEIVKMKDAAEYFKMSNREQKAWKPIIEGEKKGMKIKGMIKQGTLVLFYKNTPEELWEMEGADLRNRLYFVRKTSKDGRATFQFHQEARNDEQLKEGYKAEFGTEPPKSLTNGESKIDFENPPVPRLLLSPGNMQMLLQEVDFKISPMGKIQFLQ